MATIKEILVSSVGEPVHIKLEKNSKGYNWEIGIYSESASAAMADIVKIDAEMRARYGVQA